MVFKRDAAVRAGCLTTAYSVRFLQSVFGVQASLKLGCSPGLIPMVA